MLLFRKEMIKRMPPLPEAERNWVVSRKSAASLDFALLISRTFDTRAADQIEGNLNLVLEIV